MLYAVETAVIRWYSLLNDDVQKKSLIFSVFSFLLVLNLLILFISSFYSQNISSLLFNSGNFSEIVILCILISTFETLLGIPLVILRIKEKAFLYSSVVIIETIFSLFLQIYFITQTDYGIKGIFYSKLAASFLAFLILVPTLLKTINLKLNFGIFSEVIKFALPLMTASLVSTLFNNIDRYILGYLTDSGQVGLYGLGYNIAGVLTFLLISPFALAFPPIFWKKINDENSSRFFTKSMTYSFFVFIYGALVLSLVSPFFIKIFARNPDYWAAKNIVPLISFSLVFYGMQVVGFMSFYHSKKTSIVLLVLLVSLILNVMLNFLLIPHFKMYGAAFATFISFAGSVLLIYKFSKKYYFIKWENYKLFISMLLAVIIVIPFYMFKIESTILSIALSLIAIIVFPFILYPLRFYEEIELLTIKKFFLKYLKK
jgi:O-antigen/teichoic acid export membrane protein